MTRAGDERGSATVLVLGIAAVVLAAGLATALLAAAVAARHRAQAAADLAALAAASRIGFDGGSCAAASETASRNGGTLQECSVRTGADGLSGTVDVAVSIEMSHVGWTATGRARAARLPG